MRIGSETRALVTGASRGIGRALCERLAEKGARIGLVARDRDRLGRVIAELPPPAEGEHVALAADVGRRRALEQAVERFCKRAGGLDLLVANAGIAHYGPFPDQSFANAEEMVRINVLGTLHTVEAGLGPMLDAGRGHVVVVSSGAALRAFPWGAVYGGTKAFGRGFAEALRHELSGTGVSVTTVFPGEVETSLHDHQRERLPDWRRDENTIPAGQVAEAIVAGVESDRREVHVPSAVRALALNDIAPRLVDRLVARARGSSAAPRRD